VDVNKAWETIRENIKMSAKESLGYYEPKKRKPWFCGNIPHTITHANQSLSAPH
jgi:hypothetical protein